jgi:hypothetical protein
MGEQLMSSTRSRLKSGSGPRWRQARNYKAAAKWLPAKLPTRIPQEVLDELSRSNLPPSKEAYTARLQQLLDAHKPSEG